MISHIAERGDVPDRIHTSVVPYRLYGSSRRTKTLCIKEWCSCKESSMMTYTKSYMSHILSICNDLWQSYDITKSLPQSKSLLRVLWDYIAKPVYERGSSIRTLPAMAYKLLMHRRASGNGTSMSYILSIEHRIQDEKWICINPIQIHDSKLIIIRT